MSEWSKSRGSHPQQVHYSIFGVSEEGDAMDLLRGLFPTGEANELNTVLFSTSGVHGCYTSIEEVEATLAKGVANPDEDPASVTFLVIQPRTVTLRYGNCWPQCAEDIKFLKGLRSSSWKALARIGKQ